MNEQEMITKVIAEISRDAQIEGILHRDKWVDTAERIVKLFAIPDVINSVCELNKKQADCEIGKLFKECPESCIQYKQTDL